MGKHKHTENCGCGKKHIGEFFDGDRKTLWTVLLSVLTVLVAAAVAFALYVTNKDSSGEEVTAETSEIVSSAAQGAAATETAVTETTVTETAVILTTETQQTTLAFEEFDYGGTGYALAFPKAQLALRLNAQDEPILGDALYLGADGQAGTDDDQTAYYKASADVAGWYLLAPDGVSYVPLQLYSAAEYEAAGSLSAAALAAGVPEYSEVLDITAPFEATTADYAEDDEEASVGTGDSSRPALVAAAVVALLAGFSGAYAIAGSKRKEA